MKKLTTTIFVLAIAMASLFASPGGLPKSFKVENLTTKECITSSEIKLTDSYVGGIQVCETPAITFSKGIYAKDRIKITIYDGTYSFYVWGWSTSYNSQQENVIPWTAEGEYGSHSESVTYLVPSDLPQDNIDMSIRSYISYYVSNSSPKSTNVDNETFPFPASHHYLFKFSGVHKNTRYVVDKEFGDMIIIVLPPQNPPTNSSAKKSASTAKLYDSFGNIKKTVLLNGEQTRIYTGDLNHGIYILKFSIDGVEFTEKVPL